MRTLVDEATSAAVWSEKFAVELGHIISILCISC